MRRAALLPTLLAAALVGGCGGSGSSGELPATTAAAAACTKPELVQALRRLGTASTVAVQSLRCRRDYALTRVREGERRSVLLWQQAAGTWSLIARDKAGTCPEQAAARSLCTVPPADPALRRCTRAAFLAALREDVDDARLRVDRLRCRGDYASTRFVVDECAPGESAETRDGCRRTRIAAWRRDEVRWRLITYRDTLDCATVKEAAAGFPASLCR